MSTRQKSGDGSDPTLGAELERRIVAAAGRHGQAIEELYRAVCAYYDSLRLTGLSRQESLTAMRAFVVAIQSRDGDGRDPPPGVDAANAAAYVDDVLVERIVGRCTERASDGDRER